MTYFRKKSDQTVRILSQIEQLFRFQPVSIKETAQRFNVHERTIRRDLKTISRHLPIKKRNGLWRIDLSQTSQPFDGTLKQAFAESLRIQSACLDRTVTDKQTLENAVRYHKLPKVTGRKLFQAITNRKICRFHYKEKKGRLPRRIVAPVKLLSYKGTWLLIGFDMTEEQERCFQLNKIRYLEVLNETYRLPEDQLRRLEAIRDPWCDFDTLHLPIRVEADKLAASYLLDHPLHPSQTLQSRHADGTAVFTYQVSQPMELLPKIKSWIPHLKVLQPQSWQEMIKKELADYLKKI